MRSDAVAKREALVGAARRLFADIGYDVPLRTVAVEAGVGIATLYRHFPTREDLMLGVADSVREQVKAICARARDAWATDPAAAWRRFVDELAGMHMGALAGQLQAARGLEFIVERRPHSRTEIFENLDSVLTLARRDRFAHPRVGTLDFHLGLGAIARRFPDQPFVAVPEDHERWLIDIYLAGLRAGPAT